MVFKNLIRLRLLFTSSSSSLRIRTFTFLNTNPSFSSAGLLSVSSYLFSHSSDPCKSQISSFSSVAGQDPSQEKCTEQRWSSMEENESEDEWWQESESGTKPKMGDGGSGGGVVLNNLTWGDRALSVALDALSPFGRDMRLFALKASPREAIFVRLDKLSNKYGCPSLEDLDIYSHEIKKRLDEAAKHGEVPENLGVLVSTPGADRLLKVPDDLHRFKELPMRVCYEKIEDPNRVEKTQVLVLESIEVETVMCVWKLANVKENCGPLGKGRPLSRKMKDWRLKLPFETHKAVSLYIP